MITGGSGRSILIGDWGSDTITGGSGDDILVGGVTSYDLSSIANDLAHAAIFHEWQSGDDYNTRITKILAGVGSSVTGQLAYGTTVFDDGASSSLAGAAGTEWFFVGTLDNIVDRQPGERKN